MQLWQSNSPAPFGPSPPSPLDLVATQPACAPPPCMAMSGADPAPVSQVWADAPALTTPLLKFVAEFCFNKSQRLTFDSSSPNGILLFRSAVSRRTAAAPGGTTAAVMSGCSSVAGLGGECERGRLGSWRWFRRACAGSGAERAGRLPCPVGLFGSPQLPLALTHVPPSLAPPPPRPLLLLSLLTPGRSARWL